MKNRAVLCAIIFAFAIAIILKLFCFDFIITEGESMETSIHNGSMLFVNKLAFGFRPPFLGRYIVRWSEPLSGDVLVFWTPLGDLAVKRCLETNEDGFFALGDNGPASFDSRSYGHIPQNNIVGKVIFY